MSQEDRVRWVAESKTAVDKWRLTTIHALSPCSLRRGELQRALGRILARRRYETRTASNGAA